MNIALPEPVARYFEAQAARDVDAQTQCFTDDAIVHDEDHDHRGKSAIREWKQAVQNKFEYTSEPVHATQNGNTTIVDVRLTGNFPGSPVNLDHTFTLSGDKISSLVIE